MSFWDKCKATGMRIAAGAKNNAPTILIIAGVIEGVAAVGAAIVATKKVIPVIEACQEDIKTATMLEEAAIEDIEKQQEDMLNNDDLDKADEAITTIRTEARKTRFTLYLQAGKILFKHFWLPSLLEVASVISIYSGHRMQMEKEASLISSLAAATATIHALEAKSEEYDDYRDEVKATYGEEAEAKIVAKVLSKKKVDENGKPIITKRNIVEGYDDEGKPILDRFFFVGSSKSFDYSDRLFNVQQALIYQNILQSTLSTRGWIASNDINTIFQLPQADPMIGNVWGFISDPKIVSEPSILDLGIGYDKDHLSESVLRYLEGDTDGFWIHIRPDYNLSDLIEWGSSESIREY